MIIKIAEGNLKTKFGEYREYLFYDGLKESIALVMGEVVGRGRCFVPRAFVVHFRARF